MCIPPPGRDPAPLLPLPLAGQQWVSEVALPCGTAGQSDGRDLAFMRDLLELVEKSDLPAPSPIEQRWTAASSSRMSPAHSAAADDLHTWVGVIMYLPTEEPAARAAITRRFWEYNALCRNQLWPQYGAHQHWAKIELPDEPEQRASLKRRLRERFPLEEFNKERKRLDPKGILVNDFLAEILDE